MYEDEQDDAALERAIDEALSELGGRLPPITRDETADALYERVAVSESDAEVWKQVAPAVKIMITVEPEVQPNPLGNGDDGEASHVKLWHIEGVVADENGNPLPVVFDHMPVGAVPFSDNIVIAAFHAFRRALEALGISFPDAGEMAKALGYERPPF